HTGVLVVGVSAEARRDLATRSPLGGRGPRTGRAAAGFAAAMLLVVVLYYAVPAWNLGLWLTLGLSGCAACVAGTALNRPARRLPGHRLAAAMFTLINGDTIYNFLTDVLHQDEPFPSAADASYLFTYPLAAVGLTLMIRMRSPHRNATALVDALLLAC